MAVAKSEKPSFTERVKRYFRGIAQEMKKVHWPERKTLAIYTAVVIFVSLVIAFAIWVMDIGIGALMNLILS
jgi:preprotein translocase subunit SecE